MDPLIGMSMVFTLVILAMVGGFILVYPLMRRLARVWEKRLLQEGERHADEDILALTRAVESLHADVERLAERQDFTEKLLENPRRGD